MSGDVCECCGQLLVLTPSQRLSAAFFQEQYGLTRTEAKLFAILDDGKLHIKEELLLKALGKEFASDSAIRVHISRMRLKLAPHGIQIIGNTKSWTGGGWRLVKPEVAA